MEIETPLLVPSLSSKADQPWAMGTRKETEIVPVSVLHSENFLGAIDEAILVSAYDIHLGNLHQSAAFISDFKKSMWAEPNLVFVDSGWYEKGVDELAGSYALSVIGPADADNEPDSNEVFSYDDYCSLIDRLDEDFRGVVVGWDAEGSYDKQIDEAQRFFGDRRFISCVLIKPEGTRETHDFSRLSEGTMRRLRHFQIVGVTEKELGHTVLDRLASLSRMRSMLDDAGVDAPVHVFGGLDPLMTPLYFAAGAEIVDGLSWLRYALIEGIAAYREAPIVLNLLSDKRIPMSVSKIQLDNLDAIRELRRQMKVFLNRGGDWDQFTRGEALMAHHEALLAKIGGRDGR